MGAAGGIGVDGSAYIGACKDDNVRGERECVCCPTHLTSNAPAMIRVVHIRLAPPPQCTLTYHDTHAHTPSLQPGLRTSTL